MTATEGRELALPLDFLGAGSYEAELYLDHPAGRPNSVTRRKQAVSAVEPLRLAIPRAGGFAARLMRTVR